MNDFKLIFWYFIQRPIFNVIIFTIVYHKHPNFYDQLQAKECSNTTSVWEYGMSVGCEVFECLWSENGEYGLNSLRGSPQAKGSKPSTDHHDNISG